MGFTQKTVLVNLKNFKICNKTGNDYKYKNNRNIFDPNIFIIPKKLQMR